MESDGERHVVNVLFLLHRHTCLPFTLVDLDGGVQLGQLLLQQLQVRVDEAQLECDRVLELLVRGGLVKVFGTGPQPELLVDFLVQLAPLALQLAATGGDPWVRTLFFGRERESGTGTQTIRREGRCFYFSSITTILERCLRWAAININRNTRQVGGVYQHTRPIAPADV